MMMMATKMIIINLIKKMGLLKHLLYLKMSNRPINNKLILILDQSQQIIIKIEVHLYNP